MFFFQSMLTKNAPNKVACLSRGQSLYNKLFGRKREVVAVRHYRIPGGARDHPSRFKFFNFLAVFGKHFAKQDCIPVGCVPPARLPYLPACSAGGEGGLLWGVSGLGGVCSQGRVCLLWVCLLRGCVCSGGVCVCRSSTCTHVIHTSSTALLMVSVDLNYLSTLTGSGY